MEGCQRTKGSKDHTAANCSRRKEYGQADANGSSCKKFQHKLQHNNNIATISGQLHPRKQQHYYTANGNRFDHWKDNVTVEANVFFDSGCQICMIRNALALSVNVSVRK